MDAFNRLRSIQFDPIAPVGCNHDLVLQSRVPSYKIGDWQKTAYTDRLIYDGWDKQASLVPYDGWPLRRIFHTWYRQKSGKVFETHPHAIEAILKELQDRGPLMPKDLEFQERFKEEQHSWVGPSVTKQALRGLWHSGLVMTAGRKKGQHVYNLTERVVPPNVYAQPLLDEREATIQLMHDRYQALGLMRQTASYEVWSYQYAPARKMVVDELTSRKEIVAISIEGLAAHATPGFLELLDQPSLEPAVRFIAPLDQLIWDRKLLNDVFGFDYIWEIYTPEVKRRWGYYVLPILYGNELVARVEFWSRKDVLEIRRWHFDAKLDAAFYREFKRALKGFMKYCGATRVEVVDGIEPKVAAVATAVSK